jgi:Lanthionine synthetase C-like protein/HopA1 effector protein family
MPDYRSQLSDVITAVRIHSPTAFSWFGKRSPRLMPRIEREITPRTARSFLHYNLQSRLYSHFYCPGAAIPARDDEPAGKPGGLAPFVERLSEANCGQGYWTGGWAEVEQAGLGPGLISAGRAGLLLLVGDGEYKKGPVGIGSISPGESELLVRFGKELPSISPGFYMALGDLDLDAVGHYAHESGRLVRFYWHVTPEGAVALMRLCTQALNEAQIPFKLKALNDPQSYSRADAAVLYIRQAHYPQVAFLLENIHPRLRTKLREAVPAFTKQLAPGLGLAEDPGEGDSFGLNRCGLVAEGLIRAYEAGSHPPGARLEAVADRFTEVGLSLDQPYLSPNSTDIYTFLVDGGRTGGRTTKDEELSSPLITSGQPPTHNPHSDIATQLIADAVWYEGMCTWLGTEVRVEAVSRAAGTRREEWAALGPDFYTGTAGVGLFLAEYAALTGDSAARKASLGAFRHAFSKADSIRPEGRLGLYTGWMGIALAAARASHLLNDDELSHLALELARRCASENYPRHEHDLLAGSAGAVVGCVVLTSLTGERFLLDYAVRLGDDLLASAHLHKRIGALSWPAVSARTAAPLTGFSHGTAGIGCALLELWHATGDTRFREAAQGAFRYEQFWFNPLIRNWPDFRETGPTRGKSAGRDALAYVAYWCHGAPGIALSRLRAYALTADPARREEALAGIRTTERALRSDLAMSTGGYSLCHGLAGNATVLLHAAHAGVAIDSLHSPSNLTLLARKVAGEGVRRYETNGWWACGTGIRPHAQAPGLMLGLAGIGHFYLRLAHPEVPSVLLIEPEAWSAS